MFNSIVLIVLILAVVALVIALQARRAVEELAREVARLRRERERSRTPDEAVPRVNEASVAPPPPVGEESPTSLYEKKTRLGHLRQHLDVPYPIHPPVPLEPVPRDQDREPAPLDEDNEPQARDQNAAAANAEIEPLSDELSTSPSGEAIVVRLCIWVGAIALALAGIYLVKYSFDRDLLTAPIRLSIAALFGIAMLVAGHILTARSPRIAQALVAAGIAVIFADLVAGVNVERLISPSIGFVALAAVTALAVMLSLRHGPFVALLGLVGGYLTPALVSTGERRPAPLFAYLLLLQIGMIVVTRRRGWWVLSALTLLGAMAWALTWIIGIVIYGYDSTNAAWVSLFLLGSVVTFAFSAAPWLHDHRTSTEGLAARALVWCAAVLGFVLLSFLVGVSRYSLQDWLFLALLGAGCLALARLSRTYQHLGWPACGMTLLMLVIWRLADEPMDAETAQRFMIVASVMAGLYVLVPFALLWHAARPDHWAGLCVLGGVGLCIITCEVYPIAGSGLYWWMIPAALAGLYALGAWPMVLRRSNLLKETALDAFCFAVTFFLAYAAWLGLEHWWISVAWAGIVLLLAAADVGLRTRVLRPLAAVLALMLTLRLLVHPGLMHYPISAHPLYNWLLPGYLTPVCCFIAAAALYRWSRDITIIVLLQILAVVLTLTMLALLIHHAYHPTDLASPDILFFEWMWISIAWYVLAGLLLAPPVTRTGPAWAYCGAAVAALALTISVGVLGLVQNPMMTGDAVGATPIFNGVLLAYGVPVLVLPLLALLLRRIEPVALPLVAATAALILLFALVSLEVRQAFHGSNLQSDTMTSAENYTYSASWAAMGILLLLAGTGLRNTALPVSLLLRWSSLAFMLITTLKVFLVDTAHLRDLYRVFSFLGLGLSLILLGLIYQHVLFRAIRGKANALAR
ncbi:MAG: DUF2339 domain-containing protein [Phycisphaeraceae bacterium]